MWNVAVVGPGFKPVPDVKGGAVEHLITVLLDENEYYKKCHFDVYTTLDPLLDKKFYKQTQIIQIKNYQTFFPVRIMFSFLNRTYKLFRIKKSNHYMSCILPLYIKKGYDFILVENNIEIFFRLRRRFPNTKIIFHIHNDFDTVDTDYDKTKKRVKKLGERADMILTASHYLASHIRTITSFDRIYTLENCIDKNRFAVKPELEKISKQFRYKNGITDNNLVIMFGGRFDKWKGVLEFLQAIEKMNGGHNLRILLIGSSWFYSKEEKEYCKKINCKVEKLKDKIIYYGYVPQERMQEMYAVTDVVAIPSQCVEAFGMVALEAISMGKPCVASACGGLLDILDESCARLIPIGDNYSQRFAQALDELNKDRKLLKQLGEGAKEKAKKFSNRKVYYKSFIELLKKAETINRMENIYD